MDNKKLVKFAEALTEGLQGIINAREQEYVVAIKRTEDEGLIGYHLSTACEITDDILRAKRYDAAGDLAEQLQIIQDNYDTLIEDTDYTGIFGKHNQFIQENYFDGLGKGDFYLEPVYLEEGTDKQEMKAKVIL